LATATFRSDIGPTGSLNAGAVDDALTARGSESRLCEAARRSAAQEIPAGRPAAGTPRAAAPGTRSPLTGPTANEDVPGQSKTPDNISPRYETRGRQLSRCGDTGCWTVSRTLSPSQLRRALQPSQFCHLSQPRRLDPAPTQPETALARSTRDPVPCPLAR